VAGVRQETRLSQHCHQLIRRLAMYTASTAADSLAGCWAGLPHAS